MKILDITAKCQKILILMTVSDIMSFKAWILLEMHISFLLIGCCRFECFRICVSKSAERSVAAQVFYAE